MSNPEDEVKTEIPSTIPTNGKLVFPDQNYYEIDNAKRFVGRADLKKYTNRDPNHIARFQFIIYKKGENFFLDHSHMDGTAPLQLENGQVIRVSDVEMKFEV